MFDKGKVVLKVKAGSAVYNTFTKDLTLGGGVEITGGQGQKITGAGADWNSATQTLLQHGPVDLQTNSGTATTGALRVDLKARKWTCGTSRDGSKWRNPRRIAGGDTKCALKEQH